MKSWTTRAHEPVSLDDVVALSVLEHADAVGRIVAELDGGLIRCALVRGGNTRPGQLIDVEEDQLLVRVYG